MNWKEWFKSLIWAIAIILGIHLVVGFLLITIHYIGEESLFYIVVFGLFVCLIHVVRTTECSLYD